jgi:hypothetical protein
MIDPRQAMAILASADIIHYGRYGRRRGSAVSRAKSAKGCATATRCCCA